jgi:perosamine synthetase
MKKKLKLKNNFFIPVNEPLLTNKDENTLIKAVKSGWISSKGEYIEKFEKSFSRFIKKKFSVTVSNGSAALDIALKAINLKKNDEVIIPNFTIISNALSVLRQGAKIKLVDCKISDWNMDVKQIKKIITKKTKAIIATHIYNFPCDIVEIKKICKKNKIILIEDAAEVIGLNYKNNPCGSFGDISTFSFYANKHITTGEGGMISTNNKKFYYKFISLKNLCFGSQNRFHHSDIGWNYRFTNLQAALGFSQLKRINLIVKIKKKIGKYYYDRLKTNKHIFIPPPKINDKENIYWVVGIVIKSKIMKAKDLSKLLKLKNIETRPFFYPMSHQKILKSKIINHNKKNFPNSNFLSEYGLYLPSGLNLNTKKIDYIIKTINNILV